MVAEPGPYEIGTLLIGDEVELGPFSQDFLHHP